MVLSALNWRKLPPRTVTGSSVNLIMNNIYDMLTGSLYFDGSTRVAGSGSAWQSVGKFITGSGTGSNTEAVYCYPPTTTEMSQSVIIAGINTTGAATLAGNVAYASASAMKAGDFAIACVKNAKSFSSWSTALNGFGVGSQSTGLATFYSGSLNGVITPKITIYESQEAIGIFFNPTPMPASKTYGGFAGAIVDPEQTTTSTDAESDNRLYGITTTPCGYSTNSDGIQTSWTIDPHLGLFCHGAGTGSAKFLVFNPQNKNTRNVQFLSPSQSAYLPLYTISGKFNKYPMTVVDVASSTANLFVGSTRGVYMFPDSPTNQVIRDSAANIYGFTVARAETSTGDTIILPY